jgi:hypothetical protein
MRGDEEKLKRTRIAWMPMKGQRRVLMQFEKHPGYAFTTVGIVIVTLAVCAATIGVFYMFGG